MDVLIRLRNRIGMEIRRKREIVSLPLCAQGHSNLLVFLIIWPAVILVQHQTDVASRSAGVPAAIIMDQSSQCEMPGVIQLIKYDEHNHHSFLQSEILQSHSGFGNYLIIHIITHLFIIVQTECLYVLMTQICRLNFNEFNEYLLFRCSKEGS